MHECLHPSSCVFARVCVCVKCNKYLLQFDYSSQYFFFISILFYYSRFHFNVVAAAVGAQAKLKLENCDTYKTFRASVDIWVNRAGKILFKFMLAWCGEAWHHIACSEAWTFFYFWHLVLLVAPSRNWMHWSNRMLMMIMMHSYTAQGNLSFAVRLLWCGSERLVSFQFDFGFVFRFPSDYETRSLTHFIPTYGPCNKKYWRERQCTLAGVG